MEEAILDRLPYPFLDQSLGYVWYASAVSSELGQLLQILPSCYSKGYRSALSVGHGLRLPWQTQKRESISTLKRVEIDSPFINKSGGNVRHIKKGGQVGPPEMRPFEAPETGMLPLLDGGWARRCGDSALLGIMVARKS